MKTFSSIQELQAFKGMEAGPSEWHRVTQEEVNLFADATGDHQWIHIDPERARRESPFGGPVAHGFFTLSLLPMITERITLVHGLKSRVNYGLDKVRFTAPVPVGAKLRIRATLQTVDDEGDGVVKVAWLVTFEIEGGDKPVCVALSLAKLYF